LSSHLLSGYIVDVKAWQLIAPAKIETNPLRMMSIKRPTPEADCLLIRVLTCGICHTDLHVVQGDLPPVKTPIVPGHQAVGIIEQVGTDVGEHRVGDRVGVGWMHRTCESCAYCLRGDENLCSRAQFTGYSVDGGFAEYLAATPSFVYPIPRRFSDEAAAPLLCAGIVGFRALRLSNIQPGGRLGLYGFGASAHIVIQIARHWGCEVYVFSRSAHHRRHAEQLGAVWSGTVDHIPPHALDSSISFAPVGEIIPRSLEVLERGGTLALAGITMSSIPTLPYSILYNEKMIRSVANATRRDARDFLRLADEIPIATEIEVFPFTEANTALHRLKESSVRGAAVLRVAE
jgi:propanol-preferring alcohol dehydrogenase